MRIDFGALDRVLGRSAEDFGELCEELSDLADAPALVCMAVEAAQARGVTVAEAMRQLLADGVESN